MAKPFKCSAKLFKHSTKLLKPSKKIKSMAKSLKSSAECLKNLVKCSKSLAECLKSLAACSCYNTTHAVPISHSKITNPKYIYLPHNVTSNNICALFSAGHYFSVCSHPWKPQYARFSVITFIVIMGSFCFCIQTR